MKGLEHIIYALFINIFLNFTFTNAQNPHKRFEYKYSFKGPYLAQKDNQVPFWTYSGNAIASEESLRITPSLRSQKGQAWSTKPTSFEWWEIEVVFRVNGRGRIGADGLALWFTSTPGFEGPVFGSSDKWNGLGVFFDSFDNDNKRNNPYVMAMVNDGTQIYDHEHDGMSQQLGGCLRDFRNKPFPVRAKIEYYKNVLTLQLHNGMTNNERDFEICMRAENVFLPPIGHFGVTAATGGLADDHDVLKFLVSSLRSPEEIAQMRLSQEEEERFQKEFEQYQEKTQKARDDYIAQNPDSKPPGEAEYETSEQQELRQIFDGQSQIYDAIRTLNNKMDDIIGRQERTMSLVNAVQTGGQPATGGAVPPAPGMGAGALQRHEVDSIMTNQREIVQSARDIKSYVTDIHQKSQELLKHAQKPVGSAQVVGGGGGSYDMHVTLKELNEGLNIVKRDLGIANQRLSSGGVRTGDVTPGCPQLSCVSTTMVLVFMVGQLVVLLGYFMYRDSKEAQAKKFY